MRPTYPLLSLVDAVSDGNGPVFAAAPNAAELEAIAQELAGASWSEYVWLTGRISHRALRTLRAALERAVTGEDRPTEEERFAGERGSRRNAPRTPVLSPVNTGLNRLAVLWRPDRTGLAPAPSRLAW